MIVDHHSFFCRPLLSSYWAGYLMTASDLIAVSLVFGVPLLVLFVIFVAEVVFRKSEAGQRWRRLRRIEKKLTRFVGQLKKEEKNANARFSAAARRYERHYIDRHLRRRPIRDLRPYIEVSMSWSALEGAGIDNLQQFFNYRGHFENIHGIGEARGRALRRAKRVLNAELAEHSLPMPTPRKPNTPEFQVVAEAVCAIAWRSTISPAAQDLGEQLDHIRRQRPGGLGARWKVWTKRGAELTEELELALGKMESLEKEAMPRVQRLESEIDDAGHSAEELVVRYREQKGEVKRWLDTATERPLRGAMRPVGAAAMRTAEGFDDEEDFCDRALEPLVDKLGYDRVREHTIQRRIGSRDKVLYVDFLLRDEQGRNVAVLEAKSSIRTDRERENARDQGLSYAMFEEIGPVMIAAPQGLWLYERQGQKAVFCRKWTIEEAYADIDGLRNAIDRLCSCPAQ